MGLATLFAGSQANQPTTTKVQAVDDAAQSVEVAKTREFATRKPAPAKPTAQPVARRTVAVQPRELMPASFVRFIEKPHQRKVQYGKHRWVIV